MSRRRNWLAAVVAASLAFTGLYATHAIASSFAATVVDAQYRSCITSKLGLAADAEPSAEQLASLTELSCTNQGITDITGTSAMPKLTKLFLGGNQISDLTPLGSSTQIFSLGLENNQISNIAPLAALSQLSALTVNGNQLADLSALSVLPHFSLGSGTRYGQKAALRASAGVPAMLPSALGARGNTVLADAPDDPNVSVNGKTVTYNAPGSYQWSFRDESDFYFNGTITVTVAADGTTLPDANLRSCVNSKLSLPSDAMPTVAQLGDVSGTLSCQAKGVRDLTGLSLMPKLTGLSLKDNLITDLRPISALSGLTVLRLDRNDFLTLAGLGNDLTKVMTIELQQTPASTKTKLASLAGIEKLTSLTSITANYTAISSLAPLAGTTSVKNLTATDTRITDVTPLASAGAQLVTIDLSGNAIGDLSSLSKRTFTKLAVNRQSLTAPNAVATRETTAPTVTTLDGTVKTATAPDDVTIAEGKVTYANPGTFTWTFQLDENLRSVQFGGTITQVVDPAPPAVVGVDIPDAGLRGCLAAALAQDASAPITAEQLASLTTISCVNAGVKDLSGAEHLTNVSELVLSTNAISDVSALAGLTGLRKLTLAGNAISDPSPLASLTDLSELTLSYNPISSVASLAPLVNLTNLEVTQKSSHSGADLTSLTGVENMTKLTRLVVNNSSLTSIEPVSGLSSLTSLYVSGNQIADLTPVSNLTQLTKLGANTNKINDVRPLSGLTQLTDVDLASNQIDDLSPLKNLTDLGYLGLKARWQTVTAISVPASQTVAAPQPRTPKGTVAEVTPPTGITVSNGKVRYPAAGNYTWTFSSASDEGTFFSGTITVPVSAPAAGAADIPDAGLRSCLATSAGLSADAYPTASDLAHVTAVSCANKKISDLDGAELLTSAKTADFSGNPLGSVTQLSGLTSLTELNLNSTGLTSIAALKGLTGLTSVHVDGNHLADLSALKELPHLSTVSANHQALQRPSAAGGALVSIPTVLGRGGETIAARAPQGAETKDGGVAFSRAGTYTWEFGDSGAEFTGTFTQVITSDVVDHTVNDGADSCVKAGRVWVFVERDTGLQQGGCAAKFSTGLEALTSAGFTTTGTSFTDGFFITGINGYPGKPSSDHYWSYWHADKPEAKNGKLSYSWAYSQKGAKAYHPKAGSIEGWRFISLSKEEKPSWTPTFDAPASNPMTATSVTAYYGRSAVVTVRVAGASAGTVTATAGKLSLVAALRNGVAQIVVPARAFTPGRYTLALSYRAATGTDTASTTASFTVAKAPVKLAAKLSGKRIKYKKTASFIVTAAATGAVPSGTVTVTIGSRTRSVKLNKKGVAVVKFTKFTYRGNRTITVRYLGNTLCSATKASTRVKVIR